VGHLAVFLDDQDGKGAGSDDTVCAVCELKETLTAKAQRAQRRE
jgi:hypothetical protein